MDMWPGRAELGLDIKTEGEKDEPMPTNLSAASSLPACPTSLHAMRL